MTAEEKLPLKGSETKVASSRLAPTHQVPALRRPSVTTHPKKRMWLWGTAGLVGVVMAFFAYSQFWMSSPLAVAVEVATYAPVTRVLAVNGRVAAVNSVDIRPLVSGTLVAPLAAEGDYVQAGQVVARIDSAAQNAVVRQVMAGLDAALVAQTQATETYDRAVSLGENIARTVLEADGNALQSATQEVARQTALLDQAQIGLENYFVRAPFAGNVVTLNANLGQLVGPTTPLLTIAELTDLVVETDVDEVYATQIALDQPAVLQLAGETGNRNGHVSFVSTRVDVATGGLAIKIAFDDDVSAPIGLTVAINIIVDQRDASLTVARTALHKLDNTTGVYLVRDGMARFHPVTAVDWPAARLIVTDGLAESDIVIMDASSVTDGDAVEVVQP